MNTLLLIDAHAMIHRAYHALPETLSSKDGTPTNAVYGFFLMLQKVMTEFQPTHIAVCFDTPKPTFRKELFKEYQAKRPPMIEPLKVQIPIIKDLLTKSGITCVQKEGFEADDVIGTLAEQQKKNIDRVVILTGDRDLLQLTDKNVFVITPKKGVSNFTLYTLDTVKEKFGVDARQIPDYKALAGDASDNYNTAKGIGPKTAVKLLSQYHTIENLIEHLDEVENEKWRTSLNEHKATIALFKQIATIVRDVEVRPDTDSLKFKGFRPEFKEELARLNLYSLIEKVYNNGNIKKPEEKKTSKKSPEPNDNGQIDLFNS